MNCVAQQRDPHVATLAGGSTANAAEREKIAVGKAGASRAAADCGGTRGAYATSVSGSSAFLLRSFL